MDAFWAVPELAPEHESHLLGSSSVVTKITYGKGSVTYSTFDAESTDVLRVDFVPESITADGKPLSRGKNLDQAGYVFDDSTHVLRIRHDAAKDIDIQGKDGNGSPLYVTFDDPHLAAGTELGGQYPSGVIDWPADQWRMHVPQGKFGTFNLALADPKATTAEFKFYSPRLFVGVDVYNAGSADAALTLHTPNIREMSFTLKPGELRRIRTGWRDATSEVIFEFTNAEGLRFDNLAYLPE
jgi:hypothetical protein